MTVLPEAVESERLVLRAWREEDAAALNRAIAASEDHLRPWMPWIAAGPLTDDERRELIAEWHRDRSEGRDAVYGVFARDGRIVGGSGLHRRSPDRAVLDVGYWVAADRVGRGYATELTRTLTATALGLPGIAAVDVHHDRANAASRRVPEKLGFRFLGEHLDEITAPAEEGVDCHWRLDRRRDDGVVVRTATDQDRDAIIDLVRSAFASTGRGDGGEEVDIVRRTLARGDAVPDGFELVAVDGDHVVGHVLGARAYLGGKQVAAVAPLAVAADRWGAGIGAALMRELITRATIACEPLIALLGNPAYYSRFGFEASGPLGITYRPVGEDSPYFQVLRLAEHDETYRGDLVYCWER